MSKLVSSLINLLDSESRTESNRLKLIGTISIEEVIISARTRVKLFVDYINKYIQKD